MWGNGGIQSLAGLAPLKEPVTTDDDERTGVLTEAPWNCEHWRIITF